MDRRLWCTAALLAVLAPAAAWAAPATPTWIELETPRFTALSEVRERRSRELLEKLQVFEAALPSLTNVKARERPSIPTRVYLLDHERFVRATAHMGNVAGVFIGLPFGNDLIIDASMPPDASLSTIYHEYVHYALRTEGHVTLPAFYQEGLAQFAQSFRVQGKRFHYAYFTPGPEARSSAMPLARVIGAEVGSEDYRGHELAPAFYSRSLLLMHYFHLGNTTRQREFLRFVARVANGEAPQEAFTAEMGMPPEDFDAELDGYLAKAANNHAAVTVDVLRKPTPAVVHPVPAVEANAEFGLLLLRAGADVEGLDTIFESVLAQIPDHPAATIGMAAWHQRHARFVDADSWIEQAAALPRADAKTLVQAGELYASRTMPGEFDTEEARRRTVRARDLFRRALAKDPNDLAAAYGYGITTPPTAPDDERVEAVRIARDALERFPESAELRLAIATQLSMAGEDEAAQTLLGMVACRAVSAELRAVARKQLKSPVPCQRVMNDQPR
jgi:tetratricopeptide (TPR) repeat protein